jgi:hypothetical protein
MQRRARQTSADSPAMFALCESQKMKVDGAPLDPDCAEILKAELYKRPRGMCWCNCGKPAPIATHTDNRCGLIKGQPQRYIKGHQLRKAAELCRTHGASRTPEFKAFINARHRCTNPKNEFWKDYGGRGILFKFETFAEWFAELGPRPTPEHSVDRIRVNGNYEKGNLKWSLPIEQIHNRRISPKEVCTPMAELEAPLPEY